MHTTSRLSQATFFEETPVIPTPIVQKRDGTCTPFAAERIANAVYSAGQAVHIDDFAYAGNVTANVTAKLVGMEKVCVTEIQTLVENELMGVALPQ